MGRSNVRIHLHRLSDETVEHTSKAGSEVLQIRISVYGQWHGTGSSKNSCRYP